MSHIFLCIYRLFGENTFSIDCVLGFKRKLTENCFAFECKTEDENVRERHISYQRIAIYSNGVVVFKALELVFQL